jgi:hypothetical protein
MDSNSFRYNLFVSLRLRSMNKARIIIKFLVFLVTSLYVSDRCDVILFSPGVAYVFTFVLMKFKRLNNSLITRYLTSKNSCNYNFMPMRIVMKDKKIESRRI